MIIDYLRLIIAPVGKLGLCKAAVITFGCLVVSCSDISLIMQIVGGFSLRHLRYDLSAGVHSLSEQLFGFYNEHRESAYVMANRCSRWGGGAGYPCSGPMPVWHVHDK